MNFIDNWKISTKVLSVIALLSVVIDDGGRYRRECAAQRRWRLFGPHQESLSGHHRDDSRQSLP